MNTCVVCFQLINQCNCGYSSSNQQLQNHYYTGLQNHYYTGLQNHYYTGLRNAMQDAQTYGIGFYGVQPTTSWGGVIWQTEEPKYNLETAKTAIDNTLKIYFDKLQNVEILKGIEDGLFTNEQYQRYIQTKININIESDDEDVII